MLQKFDLKNKIAGTLLKYKIEFILFCLTLIIGLSVFIILNQREQIVGNYSFKSEYTYPVMADDSIEYYTLALNILKNDQFSMSSEPPFFPDSFRTPGYPFFLSSVLAVFRNHHFISIIQIILSSFSVVIAYRIFKMFFENKTSILAAGLFAFEPSFQFYSTLVLSDSFFLFLFLLSVYIFLRPNEHKNQDIIFKFLSGLIIGYAILTRPFAVYLPILFIVFGLARYYIFRKEKKLLMPLLAFICGTILIIFPWSLRNYNIFGSYQLSSVTGVQLFRYNAPMYYAYQNNISLENAREYFYGQINTQDSEYNRSLFAFKGQKDFALNYIKNNFPGYIKYHLIKTTPFFFSDGVRNILYQIKISDAGMPDLSGAIMKGDYVGLWQALSRSKLNLFLILSGFVFWSIVLIMSMAGALAGLYKKNKEQLFFIVFSFCLIFFFAVLAGPVFNSRYRLPAEPFLFIIASYGFFAVIDSFKRFPRTSKITKLIQ